MLGLLPLLLLLLLLAGRSEQLDGRRAAASLLPTATIGGIRRGLAAGDFTCRELIAEQLRRVDTFNERLRAFISIRPAAALQEEAAAADAAGAGAGGQLLCVPVVVKDNIDLNGLATTNGAPAFVNMTATADSEIVRRIRAAGGIIIGKGNMAEMSDSGTDSNSTLGGLCSNPWNLGRSCLGSSGGSGAAVAAGLAVLGVGTDTEGSVIGPCAAAGLLCLRPSDTEQFAAAMPGVYPAFARQDELGLMARTVDDFLTAFDAVYRTNFTDSIGAAEMLNGTTIAVLQNFYEAFSLPGVEYNPDAQMVQRNREAQERLRQLGAETVDYRVSIPELGAKLQQIIGATETKPQCANSCMKQSIDAYLARRSADPFRRTEDLLSVSSLLPSSYVEKLNITLQQDAADVCNDSSSCRDYAQARLTVTSIMEEMMGNASLLAMPFTAKLPQLHAAALPLGDQITPALNPYTGWPSVSLPVGFANVDTGQPLGLPVTMVMLAREGDELLLLRAAAAYLRRHGDVRTPRTTPELEVRAVGRVAAVASNVAAAAAVAVAFASLLR